MQHCYGTIRFIIYITDIIRLLFNCWVNSQIFCDNKQTVYIWVNQYVVGKQKAQLLPNDHAMRNVNPNLNPNHNSNWSQNYAVTVVYFTDLVTSLDIEKSKWLQITITP